MAESAPFPLPSEASRLLQAWGAGDSDARDRLIPLVYQELHLIARKQMRRERPDHTLQPSALVNEAYLRLVDQRDAGWQNRSQFFAIAARIMRRILVDHARRRRYQKRGDGAVVVPLEEAEVAGEDREDAVLALDLALEKLEAYDKRKCDVVELRYFAGLTAEETAFALQLSVVTVKRDWAFAKAWLHTQIGSR